MKLYWNLSDREGSGERGKGGQLWVERVLGPLLGAAYSGAMEGGTSQESAGAGRSLHISILLLPSPGGGETHTPFPWAALPTHSFPFRAPRWSLLTQSLSELGVLGTHGCFFFPLLPSHGDAFITREQWGGLALGL